MAQSELSNYQGVFGEETRQSRTDDVVLFPEIAPDVPVDIKGKEWIISIIEDGDRKGRYTRSNNKQIQKVLSRLRNNENNKEFYDPTIASVGPYHHGKPELEKVEKLKTSLAYGFLRDNGCDPQELYNKILLVAGDARNCYLEGSTDSYDDQEFARMMFVDGCFLLNLMDCMVEGKVVDVLCDNLGTVMWCMLYVDILLLENQLPFLVLEALMGKIFPQQKEKEFIDHFIDKLSMRSRTVTMKRQEKQGDQHDQEQPLHLLELVRKQCVKPFKAKQGSKGRSGQGDTPTLEDFSYSFRSATELKARGIHFKACQAFGLEEISFTSAFGYGQLKLPQMVFDSSTKCVCLNMMAYELAPHTKSDLKVCTYIYFMNSLINGVEDVIELRTHNIIHNFLNTDEEVANALHTMAVDVIPNISDVNYLGVCRQIQEHYNSKMKTWLAQVLHDNFSSPWTTVAFFAAIFVIALTVAQTYFQIFPRPAPGK